MDEVECVVVGAGVIGLAIARSLAMAGVEVIVLERHGSIGFEISSRNSEVIHAGIYYPAGSLKARLCVAGKQKLYRYLDRKKVAHRRCGKLIVATSNEQRAELEQIAKKAVANGVHDLEFWEPEQVSRAEPELSSAAALWSPSTGILDSHGLMLALMGDAEDQGAFVVFDTPFLRAESNGRGFVIETGGPEPTRLRSHMLVNSSGLHAGDVASNLACSNNVASRNIYYCKGNYYTLSRPSPFSTLVYPVPEADGLGVHATIDLAGRCRFGPDTEWIDEVDYEVDAQRAESFYRAVRRYWPALRDGELAPDYSGIRPKLSPRGGPVADFAIEGPEVHKMPGLVHLFGIESPGLTACLAIADEVAARLGVAAGKA